MASSSLSLYWERSKRLAICSFSIKKQDFIFLKNQNFKQLTRKGGEYFGLLTKINTSKLQIFFMQKANI